MNSRPREYDRWHLRYSMLEIQLNCHRRCQTLHIAGIENGRIILEEVKVEETEAGAAYLICATDTTLCVKNGDQYTDTPLAAAECNGLQGTFEEIKDGAAGAAGNILEGNYIIYQNEWRKCGSDIRLESNHAYLVMTNVPTAINTRAIEKSVK